MKKQNQFHNWILQYLGGSESQMSRTNLMLMAPLQTRDVHLLVCLFNKCLPIFCRRRVGKRGKERGRRWG